MNSTKSGLRIQAGWLPVGSAARARWDRGALGQGSPGVSLFGVAWRAPGGAVGCPMPGSGPGPSPLWSHAGSRQGWSLCPWVRLAL